MRSCHRHKCSGSRKHGRASTNRRSQTKNGGASPPPATPGPPPRGPAPVLPRPGGPSRPARRFAPSVRPGPGPPAPPDGRFAPRFARSLAAPGSFAAIAPSALSEGLRPSNPDAPPPHGSLIALTFARGGVALRRAAFGRALAGRLPGPARKARGRRPRLPGRLPRTLPWFYKYNQTPPPHHAQTRTREGCAARVYDSRKTRAQAHADPGFARVER